MSRTIRLLPEARAEFDDSADWYARIRPELGEMFIERVTDLLDAIVEYPQRYPLAYRSVRKAVVRTFPFVVLFWHDGVEIVVVAVFHTARNPQMWKERL